MIYLYWSFASSRRPKQWDPKSPRSIHSNCIDSFLKATPSSPNHKPFEVIYIFLFQWQRKYFKPIKTRYFIRIPFYFKILITIRHKLLNCNQFFDRLSIITQVKSNKIYFHRPSHSFILFWIQLTRIHFLFFSFSKKKLRDRLSKSLQQRQHIYKDQSSFICLIQFEQSIMDY